MLGKEGIRGERNRALSDKAIREKKRVDGRNQQIASARAEATSAQTAANNAATAAGNANSVAITQKGAAASARATAIGASGAANARFELNSGHRQSAFNILNSMHLYAQAGHGHQASLQLHTPHLDELEELEERIRTAKTFKALKQCLLDLSELLLADDDHDHEEHHNHVDG